MISLQKIIIVLVIFTVLLLYTYMKSNDFTISTIPNKVVQTMFSSDVQNENTNNEDVTCYNKPNVARFERRGKFGVLYNYIAAERTFRCNESITYTTHGDLTFLDNLEPLLERWQGPVSMAMHAPGMDFNLTLEAVRYARACLSPLVKQYVTFHLYFGKEHAPGAVPMPFFDTTVDCTAPAPWVNVTSADLYKSKNNLLYPVNVGRNIARETALTHFVLPSDIELYPSPGVIKGFLDMVGRRDPPLLTANPKVFPLAIFEVKANMAVPNNKTELVSMLKTGSAILFHKRFCAYCHAIPNYTEWMAANESSGLHVFTTGKRLGKFWSWEPIFIGTHNDPLYDERLSWEGMKDKMTQGFAMCSLDYEFQVLDNAFLVHKPGINTGGKPNPLRRKMKPKTEYLIKNIIKPELIEKYGKVNGCKL